MGVRAAVTITVCYVCAKEYGDSGWRRPRWELPAGSSILAGERTPDGLLLFFVHPECIGLEKRA